MPVNDLLRSTNIPSSLSMDEDEQFVNETTDQLLEISNRYDVSR